MEKYDIHKLINCHHQNFSQDGKMYSFQSF